MTTFYDLPQPTKAAFTRSHALSAHIQQEIEKAGRPISFASFMQMALYHPEWGYYNSPDIEIGKRGDFTTAPEISPLFAQCFARQCLPILEQLGAEAAILEFGAGSGRFATDLLLALESHHRLPNRYYIYEISPALRKKQQAFLQATIPLLYDRVTWLDQLPSEFVGIMIANEVLDALPVTCFAIEQNNIRERCVTWDKNEERFIWQLCPPLTTALTEQAMKLRELYQLYNGYESEINLSLPAFIQAMTGALSRGIILLADYGYGQREYYHPERKQGTLTCFYQHYRHDNPLLYPGLQDITAHVDFTSVIEQAAEQGCTLEGYTSQASFLLANGLMELAVEAEKNLSTVDAVNFHQAIKRLIMPMEMGEVVKVMALGKNFSCDLQGFGAQDRQRDL